MFVLFNSLAIYIFRMKHLNLEINVVQGFKRVNYILTFDVPLDFCHLPKQKMMIVVEQNTLEFHGTDKFHS